MPPKRQRRRQQTQVVRPKFIGFPLRLIPTTNNGENNYHHDDGSSHPKPSFRELGYPGSHVWVLPTFLSPKECQAWIDFCEGKEGGKNNGIDTTSDCDDVDHDNGYFQYTSHPASAYMAHRQCYRIQQEDGTELAQRIFDRIQSRYGQVLPTMRRAVLTNNNNDDDDNVATDSSSSYRPVGCNPNLRVYKYIQGHSFGRHVDESNVVPGLGRTEVTVLIYLSDCLEGGGATRFYATPGITTVVNGDDEDDRQQQRTQRGKKQKGQPTTRSSSSSLSFAYIPRVGSMLLHVHGDHCLEHEAEPVLNGSIKYVLRTDLVFAHA